MEEGVKQRLRKFIKHLNTSERQFEIKTGLSQTYVNSIRKSISPEKLKLITGQYPELNVTWLLTGEGQMLNGNNLPTAHNENEARLIDSPNVMLIPMVSQYAYAGYLNGFGDPEYMEALPSIPFFVSHDAKGKYICFEVRGDSMYDGTDESIIQGDRLLCREIPRYLWVDSKLHIRKWDFVIVHRTEGILIKRITEHNVAKQEIVIHSLNSEYEDKTLFLGDVEQIFNVVEISRPRKR